jgi:hypothetical protein
VWAVPLEGRVSVAFATPLGGDRKKRRREQLRWHSATSRSALTMCRYLPTSLSHAVQFLSGERGGLPLWFGGDGNLDVSTFLEPHIVTMFIS